jgi:hypothetical protein
LKNSFADRARRYLGSSVLVRLGELVVSEVFVSDNCASEQMR